MEEYGPWIFLQDKWPLFLVVLAVIITIITVRLIGSEKTEESRTREEWLGERLRHLKKFLLTTQ